MKKAGLIVAVEMFAVFERWGRPAEIIGGLPFKACRYDMNGISVYIVRSGPGQSAAHRAALMAVNLFGVTELWNFGVAGGLAPDIHTGDICIPDRIILWDSHERGKEYAVQLPDYFKAEKIPGDRLFYGVCCASGSSIVSGRSERLALFRAHGASIVDMEAAGIAAAAEAAGVPCCMVKCVSDDTETEPDNLTAAFRETALKAFEAFEAVFSGRPH